MKIVQLEEMILKKSSKVNLDRGKYILKNNELTKLNIHKVDYSYNVYCNFKSENKVQNYSTHLKIDLKREKITLAKCSCDMFSELEGKNNIYLCEHLIATGLKFIDEVKKKINKTAEYKDNSRIDRNILNTLSILQKRHFNGTIKENLEKADLAIEKLELNVSLKEVKENKDKCFEVSFFIGNSNMYPILNIEEFIINIISSKEYYIGKGLIYNAKKHYFSIEDKNLLEYIYEYILIVKNNRNLNSLVIPNEILKRFLKKLSSKKIKYIYNYQTYIDRIKNEDLPIFFTLKTIKDEYVLTTRKIFPIPLNEKMDVFFYDRKIYIPSDQQVKLYKIFYKQLKENGKIVFNQDISVSDLNNLIYCLNIISKNVSLDEPIINKVGNNIKIDFNFNKKDENFCCDVNLINNESIIPYTEALESNNEIIKSSKKLRLIESELNRNRFFYRNNTFVFLGNDDEYYEFLKCGIKSLEEIANINTLNDNRYFKLKNGTLDEAYLNENEKGDFIFSFKLDGINNEELNSIRNEYHSGKKYIKLSDDTFVDLQDEELIDFISMLDSLNIDLNANKDEYLIELNKLYYLNNKLNSKEGYLIKIKEKLLQRLDKLSEDTFKVPKELNATLREYQVKGYTWLKNLGNLGIGGILADEMGLGKTIQTITFLLSEKQKKSLIVTPTSLIYNWKQEFEKFTPTLNVGLIHGSKNERIKTLKELNSYDVMLTTYGTLRNDYLEYDDIKFDYLIIDEGQNINNHKSQITQIIKKIKSSSRFILTGTL